MADQNLNARIKQRIDTSANWSSVNPILLSGEIGIESDTLKLKVGDGISNWNVLSYIDGGGSASDFLDLTDTPDNYIGQSGKIIKVNDAENGLIFDDNEVIIGDIDGGDANATHQNLPLSRTDADYILNKPISISNFTGKDGYILAYNETNGEFYLKKDDGVEGGGLTGTTVDFFQSLSIPVSITLGTQFGGTTLIFNNVIMTTLI